MLADPRHIEVRDHGAGSQMLAPRRRAVADIARVGAVRPREGQQLFKLVHHYRPRYVLELGTSLGLSGLYLAKASRQARVLTLEGCPATAALARAHFAELGADNVEVREGPFQQTLPRALQALPRVDLLYLDGDHRREPTLAYVRACLPKATERSLFVVSDIHWSADMERAWAELRARPEVRLSIDLFDHGLLFFDPAIRHPTHLRLVRSRYKPWRLGLLHRS